MPEQNAHTSSSRQQSPRWRGVPSPPSPYAGHIPAPCPALPCTTLSRASQRCTGEEPEHKEVLRDPRDAEHEADPRWRTPPVCSLCWGRLWRCPVPSSVGHPHRSPLGQSPSRFPGKTLGSQPGSFSGRLRDGSQQHSPQHYGFLHAQRCGGTAQRRPHRLAPPVPAPRGAGQEPCPAQMQKHSTKHTVWVPPAPALLRFW